MKSGLFRAVATALFLCVASLGVRAQSVVQTQAMVVSTCGASAIYGTGIYAAGKPAPLTLDFTGTLCTIAGAGGGGGGGGGGVYGLTAPGDAPSGNGAKPFLNGVLDAGGLMRAVSPTNPLPVNNAQVNGASIATGAGASNAGTPRTILATDQPAIPVTGTFWQPTQPVSGTVTVNQGVAAAAASAWPVYNTVGGSAVGSGNPLPAAVVPTGLTSTPAKTVVDTTNTFKSFAEASSTRKGCFGQYRGTTTGYGFIGAAAPTSVTDAGVFQMATGQSFTCAVGANSVATEKVWVTGTAGEIFSGNTQ